jgi:hypothetical protein
VLIDHLNPLMDLIEVELSIKTGLCACCLDRIVPHACPLGPQQRHRLGHDVVPSQVDKTHMPERARQQADAVTRQLRVHHPGGQCRPHVIGVPETTVG